MNAPTAPAPLVKTGEASPVELAKKLADAACFFDFAKKVFSAKNKSEAEHHIGNLHDIAMLLAGDRVHELYGKREWEGAP